MKIIGLMLILISIITFNAEARIIIKLRHSDTSSARTKPTVYPPVPSNILNPPINNRDINAAVNSEFSTNDKSDAHFYSLMALDLYDQCMSSGLATASKGFCEVKKNLYIECTNNQDSKLTSLEIVAMCDEKEGRNPSGAKNNMSNEPKNYSDIEEGVTVIVLSDYIPIVSLLLLIGVFIFYLQHKRKSKLKGA